VKRPGWTSEASLGPPRWVVALGGLVAVVVGLGAVRRWPHWGIREGEQRSLADIVAEVLCELVALTAAASERIV
jgi:hypothetical protein